MMELAQLSRNFKRRSDKRRAEYCVDMIELARVE